MTKGLRVLLRGSVVLFVISALSMLGFAIATSVGHPSASSKAGARVQRAVVTRTPAGAFAVSGTAVCGLLSANQVAPLLNYQAPTGPGTPQSTENGGGCAWGTGRGEAFELTVEPGTAAGATGSCSANSAVPVHVRGWAGCSRLEFGTNANVMTAFDGRYRVSIRPEVNVIGFPYINAEEAAIGRVFQELASGSPAPDRGSDSMLK